MLLIVLMIFSLLEKTFCKVFVTFVICIASQLICSLCCTWNDVQTFSNGIDECHIFENTIYLCNISNNNDVIVTINVQKSSIIVLVLCVDATNINRTENQVEYLGEKATFPD